MTKAPLQGVWSRHLYACREHGFKCPPGCLIVKDRVEVVPREVADRLAKALEAVIRDGEAIGHMPRIQHAATLAEFRAVFPVSAPANSPQTTVAEEA